MIFNKKRFNSQEQSDYSEIDAPYFNAIEPTEITFEIEQTVATIDSLGHIAFFDMEGKALGSIDIPVSDDPAEKAHTAQYGNARYSANGKEIVFGLPVYYWSDNYPYCDGEFDRWDRGILSWFDVVFDCGTHQIRYPA